MDYKIINNINLELLCIKVSIVFSDDVITVNIPLYSLKHYGIGAIDFAAKKLMEASVISNHSFSQGELYDLLLNNFLKLFAERYV